MLTDCRLEVFDLGGMLDRGTAALPRREGAHLGSAPSLNPACQALGFWMVLAFTWASEGLACVSDWLLASARSWQRKEIQSGIVW